MWNSQFAQLLTPSPVVFLWQAFLSLSALMAGSVHIIIALVSGREEIVNESSLISSVVTSVVEWIDSFEASADIVTFMFWSALGSVLYAILWSLMSLIVELYRDVSFGFSFIHPQEFNRSKHWVATISTILVRAAAAIIFVSFSAYWVAQVVPGLSNLVSNAMSNLAPLPILQIVVAVVVSALCLHFMTILIRVFLLKTRIMGTS